MIDAQGQTRQAVRLARKAARHFAGVEPTVQGAALCEMVATHLAGHGIRGDAVATHELRMNLLEAFIKTVLELVPALDAEVIQPELKRRMQ